MKKLLITLSLFFTVNFLLPPVSYSQIDALRIHPNEQCGTMPELQRMFEKDNTLKAQFSYQQLRLQQAVAEKISKNNSTQRTTSLSDIVTIPVVVHIVLSDPGLVTDSHVQSIIDKLNEDFSALNADSINIPVAFKPLFGKSKLRFCLAAQTPEGEPTNGITRTASSLTVPLGTAGNTIKKSISGGADAWDTNLYFNIWIGDLTGGLLGYATFPYISPPEEQGVVIGYKTLPGTTFGSPNYNLGRTLTHEAGHFLYLFHIWGDDANDCTGNDFMIQPGWPVDGIDDTPDMAGPTSGCPSGIVTDECSPFYPGRMYNNYLDYTFDACMNMFTTNQVIRMESALELYRPGLMNSNKCQPPVIYDNDIRLAKINFPEDQVCNNTFNPVITFRNNGTDTIRSLKIAVSLDGNTPVISNWSGNLSPYYTAVATLNTSTITTGMHKLVVYTYDPNGMADEHPVNDTLSVDSLAYYSLVPDAIKEGFESTVFPPQKWKLSNPDSNITWQRTTSASYAGIASMFMDNYNYKANGKVDWIRTPVLEVKNVDSTFITFYIAAATYTYPGSSGNPFDTLELIMSTDCGQTFRSIYKKWGPSITTRLEPDVGLTIPFVPTKEEWRKDSVYLTPLLNGADKVQVTFRSIENYENNVYVDNINLYNLIVNPVLKAKGVIISPNPVINKFAVQFYPTPTNISFIQVFNSMGQLVAQKTFNYGYNGTLIGPNFVEFNLGGMLSGIYIVKVVYTNKKTLIKKLVKTNE